MWEKLEQLDVTRLVAALSHSRCSRSSRLQDRQDFFSRDAESFCWFVDPFYELHCRLESLISVKKQEDAHAEFITRYK